jgi:hypothetical protein
VFSCVDKNTLALRLAAEAGSRRSNRYRKAFLLRIGEDLVDLFDCLRRHHLLQEINEARMYLFLAEKLNEIVAEPYRAKPPKLKDKIHFMPA